MEKVNCTQCGKIENKKSTMDGICSTCWNKKSKLFIVPKN